VFKGLVDFSADVGWDLIYGADLLSTRDAENRWDPAQFKSLLRYADAQGYRLAGWELGNEPDQVCKPGYVRHINCSMPADAAVSPTQVAEDFATMRALLRASPVQQQSLLIGPDTATPSDFLTAFVKALPSSSSSSSSSAPLLDALTWHFYYVSRIVSRR
jgi:heparanase 1